jgi:peptidoglycan hydrolase-like protein with peptidoglycan-binding domain
MYNMGYGGFGMYNVGYGGFGALVEGAKKNSANTKILQKALKEAGYNPGTIDGSYGTKTQAAMQNLQAAKGLALTDWPDNYILAGLDIPYDKWVGIVTDSGAPANVVNGIAQRVAGRGGLPSDDAGAPKAVTLPSGEEVIVETTTPIPGTTQEVATLPSGEQIVVEEAAVAPAAAAVTGGTKLWFKKNWPYLAAGGGLGVVAIIAAVLWTRKREEEAPPMPTPEDVEHMAGYGRGYRRPFRGSRFGDWEHSWEWHKKERDYQERQMTEHRHGAWMGSLWKTPAERDELVRKMRGRSGLGAVEMRQSHVMHAHTLLDFAKKQKTDRFYVRKSAGVSHEHWRSLPEVKRVLEDTGLTKNIRKAYEFGWRNQPKVLTFAVKGRTEEDRAHNLAKVMAAIEREPYHTDAEHVRVKDW